MLSVIVNRRLSVALVVLAALGFTECHSSAPPDSAANDCAGPGRYEAGKGDTARACCPGLHEIFVGKASYADGNERVCDSPPLRVYACVKGSCGDGTCEPGESEPCGCVADCASAAWDTRPAAATTPAP